MGSEKLLESLFDKKILSILRLFVIKKEQKFTLKEISKYSRVSLASTFRIVSKLIMLEIVSVEKIKHLKLYTLSENDKTKYLETIITEHKTIIDEFVNQISLINGIRQIIMHGKTEKDKANILIIGDNIDTSLIKKVVVDIIEKHSFTITYLVLDEDQYNQMSSMNLYPGKKEILFQK
ncbi:MAG: hypothetical protein QXK76_04020 [Candidatus Woesearchaeota archaeon]